MPGRLRLRNADNPQTQLRAILKALALGLLFLSVGRGQRLPVKKYSVADGLLRDMVSKLRQDSRGFIWFCTTEGISNFDGYEFTNFTTNDGLPDRHVNDFLETRDGIILIATDGGIAELNPNGIGKSQENPYFSTFTPDNPKAKRVRVLYEAKDGTIFAGTSSGLFRFVNNGGNFTFESVPLDFPSTITSIIGDGRDGIWASTSQSGFFHLSPDNGLRRFTKAEGWPDSDITELFKAADGTLWVGSQATGLCSFKPDNGSTKPEQCYTSKDGLPAEWITGFTQTSDGQLWIGTVNSLCLWQGEGGKSVCKVFDSKNNLCDQEIFTTLEDKDHNLWIGSRCGVERISRYGFSNYTSADGLTKGLINSIFENSKKDLFVTVVSNNGRIVSRFDGETFTPFNPKLPFQIKYFGWGWKQTVLQDHTGTWWIPTGTGLFRSPPTTRVEDLPHTLSKLVLMDPADPEAFRVYEDKHGDVWVGTTGQENKLFRWERLSNTWKDESIRAQISATRFVTAFTEDSNDSLWIATGSDADDTALIRYRDGQFKVFTKSENKLLTGWIRDLYIDHLGRLWMSDTDTGLLRLDDLRSDSLNLVQYTAADGLSSNGVYCQTEDSLGRIYIGSGRGLDRLFPETGQVEHFTTFDGLPDNNVEICYRDHRNVLWFGTSQGLARFEPQPARRRDDPKVLITALRINGKPQSVSILGEKEIPERALDARERQIRIDFVGIGATLGEPLRYEYRINDGQWTATSQRTVNFANLSPGAYRFEIQAITADRIYSKIPAVVSVRIAAPLWQRWWVIAGFTAALALLIYFLYRYRLNKLLEIERTKIRIATDLHDDIGSDLSKISLLSDIVNMQMADNPESKRMLTTIAETSRSSVSSMRDIIWAIDPRQDSLLSLTRRMRAFAEESFAGRLVSVKFDAPPDETKARFSMETRREVFLIFKESVNNAAKHSGCSTIEIEFRVSPSEVLLRISDDGSGIDDTKETSGNGLSNMKKRTERAGGTFEIEAGAGRGTKITARIPI